MSFIYDATKVLILILNHPNVNLSGGIIMQIDRIDGLMQDCSDSIANALELLQFWPKWTKYICDDFRKHSAW